MFTDMALTAYDGSDALDVVVRSLKTAKIMSGVRVALVAKNGEDLGAGTTDASGRVRFPGPMLKGDGAAQPKMVMAYGSMGDLAVLDLDRSPVDLSAQGVGGRRARAADTTTPKPPTGGPSRPTSTLLCTPTGASTGPARPRTSSPWCATARPRRYRTARAPWSSAGPPVSNSSASPSTTRPSAR